VRPRAHAGTDGSLESFSSAANRPECTVPGCKPTTSHAMRHAWCQCRTSDERACRCASEDNSVPKQRTCLCKRSSSLNVTHQVGSTNGGSGVPRQIAEKPDKEMRMRTPTTTRELSQQAIAEQPLLLGMLISDTLVLRCYGRNRMHGDTRGAAIRAEHFEGIFAAISSNMQTVMKPDLARLCILHVHVAT
jgi:hypothetical protein